MSSPSTPVLQTRPRRPSKFGQLSSHAHLLNDISRTPQPSGRGRLDAIIVPATRPASSLARVIALAAQLQIYLVVLCSLQANFEQVADRIRRHPGARGIAVRVDNRYELPIPLRTMSDGFVAVNGGRISDLSLKRNIGLLLARRCGWNKIAFVDDDIALTTTGIRQLAHQLDSHPIAGMACRQYPDNSVLCHARRLAGFDQDVFVTGAVLGVHCGDHPLPFFPNVYNEDWFFFGEAASRRTLTKVGEACQTEYEPFGTTVRAEFEEFGDLLAEGLYLLVENQGPEDSFQQATHRATAEFWERFIKARRLSLDETWSKLIPQAEVPVVAAAVRSLTAADERYTSGTIITAEHCVEFLDAWRNDVAVWRRASQRTNTTPNVADGLATLGITSGFAA